MFKFIKKFYKFLKRRWYSFGVVRTAKSCGVDLKVNYKTKVNCNTILGDNFNSNGLVVMGRGEVIFGDNFHCGFGCRVLTENHNHMGKRIPYDETYIVKRTVIGDNVWFGINVTVLPGVTIGEGSIIQAGSVVVSDLPSLSIAGGHPAKVFSHRDGDHYFRLKSAGMTH